MEKYIENNLLPDETIDCYQKTLDNVNTTSITCIAFLSVMRVMRFRQHSFFPLISWQCTWCTK